jgi:molecular chaperone Hsp33
LASKAILKHDCDPVAGHILGRALNAGTLLSCRYQRQDHLNLHWRYPGACRDVLVDLRGDGRIRGLIHPPHLSGLADTEEELYGEGGVLNIVTGRNGKILNSGTSDCPMQHVVRDLGYALSVSEQVESELNVMIDFTHNPAEPVALCQGILLQALPGCDLEQFARIRDRLTHPEVRTVLARPDGADGLFEDVLNCLLAAEKIETHITVEPGPTPRWFCTCRPEKFHKTLTLLPEKDREELRVQGEPIVVRCDFCNERYPFTIPEAEQVWALAAPRC